MIEIDIMMDYTRLLYEELSFEKQKIIAQKTPPNFYDVWNNPGTTVTETKNASSSTSPVAATPEMPISTIEAVVPATQYNVVIEATEGVAEEKSFQEQTDIAEEPIATTDLLPEENTSIEAASEEYINELPPADQATENGSEYHDAQPEPEIVYEDGGTEQFSEEEVTDEPEVQTPVEDEPKEQTNPMIEDEYIMEEVQSLEMADGIVEEEENMAENSWEIEEELREEEVISTPSAPAYQQPIQPFASFYQPAKRTHQDIRSLIGINDKYQIISELFQNNKEAYEAALNEFNKMDDSKSSITWLNDHYTQLEQDGYTYHMLEGILHRFYND